MTLSLGFYFNFMPMERKISRQEKGYCAIDLRCWIFFFSFKFYHKTCFRQISEKCSPELVNASSKRLLTLTVGICTHGMPFLSLCLYNSLWVLRNGAVGKHCVKQSHPAMVAVCLQKHRAQFKLQNPFRMSKKIKEINLCCTQCCSSWFKTLAIFTLKGQNGRNKQNKWASAPVVHASNWKKKRLKKQAANLWSMEKVSGHHTRYDRGALNVEGQ